MSEQKLSILIVDDELVVRDSLVHWFTEEGYDLDCASNANDALAKLAAREFDLVIADIRMPGMDGIGLLEKIKSEQLDTGVIVMTGYASVETAIRALKHGAFDYITKPFDPDDLSVVARNALEQHRLKRENRMLREQLTETDHAITELVGQSEAMRQGARADRDRRGRRFHGHGRGRERNRQGAGGPRHSPPQPAPLQPAWWWSTAAR